MNVVLLGANGRTGREVLGQALSAGETVTALVRAEDKLGDVSRGRLEVRVGDACDPRVLEAILPGHDVVIPTLGPRLPTKAACVLFPSEGLPDRVLRRLTPNAVREAGRMEERIRSSSLDWTIARVGFLTNDPATGYRHTTGASPQGGKPVSRAAVARFLLAEARESARVRKVVGLSG